MSVRYSIFALTLGRRSNVSLISALDAMVQKIGMKIIFCVYFLGKCQMLNSERILISPSFETEKQSETLLIVPVYAERCERIISCLSFVAYYQNKF